MRATARPLLLQDLDGVPADAELLRVLNQILRVQAAKTFAVTVTAPYGARIWEHGKLAVELEDPECRQFYLPYGPNERIVGLVSQRVFEIYKEVDVLNSGARLGPAKALRRHTQLLLEPGMLFGLFERYPKWFGPWSIASGVVSFLVSNPCADLDKWKKAARTPDVDPLRVGNTSRCDFEGLVPQTAADAWTAQCILVWPDRVGDPALRLQLECVLQATTIQQLYSVIEQEESRKEFNSNNAFDQAYRFLAYVDSVAQQRTPIFQLVDGGNENWLPTTAVKAGLAEYEKQPECDWHILVPRPLESGGCGLYLAEYVRLFPIRGIDTLFSKNASGLKELGEARKARLEPKKIDGVQWVRYRERYLLHGLQCDAKHHPVRLVQDGSLGSCQCPWHGHFSHVVVMRDEG